MTRALRICSSADDVNNLSSWETKISPTTAGKIRATSTVKYQQLSTFTVVANYFISVLKNQHRAITVVLPLFSTVNHKNVTFYF